MTTQRRHGLRASTVRTIYTQAEAAALAIGADPALAREAGVEAVNRVRFAIVSESRAVNRQGLAIMRDAGPFGAAYAQSRSV